MHTRNILLCLGLAWIASAVPAPLNINLGAYSPALVVGDGAIAFGGGEAQAAVEAEGATEGGGEAGGEGTGGGETETEQETEASSSQSTLSTAAVRETSFPLFSPIAQMSACLSFEECHKLTLLGQDTSSLQGMGKQRLPRE